MSRSTTCVLASIVTVVLASTHPVTAQQMPTMQAAEPNLIQHLLPSIVAINVRKDAEQTGSQIDAAGADSKIIRTFGSGFVIDPSGLIATNTHVIRGAWQIDVTFADGTQVPAHLVDQARLIDVALIKVDVGHKLPALEWGDSSKLEVGDPVFAVGNSLGIGISVSGGIVSGLNRDIMDSPYDDFIQTDAAINHGNSGGPLFNMKGQVVGIDSAIISSTTAWSGIGFAIPSYSAKMVIDRLMNNDQRRPGWIGVKLQQLTPEMAQALGMKRARGAIVANLAPDGPADQAGLRPGDVVLHLAGAPPTDQRAMLRAITSAPIGQTITLVVWRDGKEQSLDIPVREWPRRRWDGLDTQASVPKAPHQIPPDLGLALAALDDANRSRFDLDVNQAGVLITGVAAGTDAADHGLEPGNVILRVQQTTVSTPQEVQATFAKARAEDRQFVLVLMAAKPHDRAGAEWVTLRVAYDERNPEPAPQE
jgi:serine protease Do